MTSMTDPTPERTAPAAPTATAERLTATQQCIIQALGLDAEVDFRITRTGGRPALWMDVREDAVLPDGREELARQLAAQIGAELSISVHENGMRTAHAGVWPEDGSTLHVFAVLERGADR